MRLIDADALIDDIKNHLWDWENVNGITAQTVLKQTITDIENQPTASPWHRVEEGLPRCQELVIVAVKDTAGDTPFWYTQCGWITTDGEYWIIDNDICDYVVAWMPLPEPPKEG